jgi:hypothetical protein
LPQAEQTNRGSALRAGWNIGQLDTAGLIFVYAKQKEALMRAFIAGPSSANDSDNSQPPALKTERRDGILCNKDHDG